MAFTVQTAPTLSVTKGGGTRTINYTAAVVSGNNTTTSSSLRYGIVQLYNQTTSTILKTSSMTATRQTSSRYYFPSTVSLASGTQSVSLPDTDTTHTIIIRYGLASSSSGTPSSWTTIGTYTVTVEKKGLYTAKYYDYDAKLILSDSMTEATSYTIYTPSLLAFDHWNTNSMDTGTDYSAGASIASPTADIELYAMSDELVSGDYYFYVIDSTNNYVRAYAADRTKTSYSAVPSTLKRKGVLYTVTALGTSTPNEGCYYGCTNLKEPPLLFCPATSMSYAFYGCSSLEATPEIPQTVTDLTHTFDGCTKLKTSKQIGGSVTDMSYAFYRCAALTYPPAITDTVTNMFHAFDGCTSLKQTPAIPDSVTNIAYAFYGCTGLKSIALIGSSVENMNYAFSGCALLTSVPYIPDSVTNISYAFNGCTNLANTIHVYGSPSTYTNAFTGTTKNIFILPHSTSDKTAWTTIVSSFGNIKVLTEPVFDTYHNTTSNTDTLTFGGFEEATINKVVSYLDFVAEDNIYLSNIDNDLIAMLTARGWSDAIIS